ncbi:methylmalonyl Co-A mutase-associated GTPase MeaB [Nitrososphaera sp. AFS]|jgi:LAO/AO transport system kinase|uniref:methylmalonyl Co-A mutase-associated GTPase MeaB n=1 Tax=Nitrososphaera sp. AFS TaxID=2301191 RepID=UPI0013923541|nr:methylmalonyl Co-A mutase-associated GTPase MeaB [Nitrososphaera sp. AFS]NAL78376.1 methylmalonyl Co-A mutase-associated GTPase MeaB [Nitrososphaera sp. AFS]
MHPLVEGVLSGDRRSLARAISVVDNKEPDSYSILSQVFYKTGKAKTVGFTGAGGAGKSSLIESLVPEFKKLGHRVAVLAVDPTSPITGGAILGDRIRMRSTMDDQSVFMRSIASRGATGGISRSVRNIIRILDAAGFTLIIVESVGAGQLEVQISAVVDVTAVVFSPQTGDNIQAIKAGLTEVGDLYIINKGDLEGSSTLFNSITDFVGDTPRKPTVMKASAKKGDGIKELAEHIEKLLLIKGENYRDREKRMLKLELKDIILAMLEDKVSSTLMKDNECQEYIEKIAKKEMDPYIAAKGLAAKLLM